MRRIDVRRGLRRTAFLRRTIGPTPGPCSAGPSHAGHRLVRADPTGSVRKLLAARSRTRWRARWPRGNGSVNHCLSSARRLRGHRSGDASVPTGPRGRRRTERPRRTGMGSHRAAPASGALLQDGGGRRAGLPDHGAARCHAPASRRGGHRHLRPVRPAHPGHGRLRPGAVLGQRPAAQRHHPGPRLRGAVGVPARPARRLRGRHHPEGLGGHARGQPDPQRHVRRRLHAGRGGQERARPGSRCSPTTWPRRSRATPRSG